MRDERFCPVEKMRLGKHGVAAFGRKPPSENQDAALCFAQLPCSCRPPSAKTKNSFNYACSTESFRLRNTEKTKTDPSGLLTISRTFLPRQKLLWLRQDPLPQEDTLRNSQRLQTLVLRSVLS